MMADELMFPDWTYMKMNVQVLWCVYGPGINSRDSDAYMMLLTRSLFRNWSWKIPPEVKNVQQLHFSFNLSISSYPFNSTLFKPTHITKHWRGSPGPPPLTLGIAWVWCIDCWEWYPWALTLGNPVYHYEVKNVKVWFCVKQHFRVDY